MEAYAPGRCSPQRGSLSLPDSASKNLGWTPTQLRAGDPRRAGWRGGRLRAPLPALGCSGQRSGIQTQCPPHCSQVPANVDPEENHQMMSLTPSRGTQKGSNSGGPGREAGPGLPPPQAELAADTAPVGAPLTAPQACCWERQAPVPTRPSLGVPGPAALGGRAELLPRSRTSRSTSRSKAPAGSWEPGHIH